MVVTRSKPPRGATTRTECDPTGGVHNLDSPRSERGVRPRILDAEERRRISAENARKIAKSLSILAE